MSALLPFGQPVIVRHKFLEWEKLWVTSAQPSYFAGHNWQYEVRTDRPLQSSISGISRWLWGGDWFDEADLEPYDGGILPPSLNIETPKEWPPRMTRMTGRRPGIWGINGQGVNQSLIDKMLGWNPGAITCFYDYQQANGIKQYRDKYPNVPIIIRFQHNKSWWQDPLSDARDKANEIISKWDVIKTLLPDVYCYFANEVNLHYENGDDNPDNQHLYETPEFYEKYADWVTILADRIKQAVPDFPLACPPFAYGHKEDGSPDDDGNITESFAGYDYLAGYDDSYIDVIETHFDNIICGHYYWGNSGGSVKDWLYGEDSKWHAFRWRKVLKMFETRYHKKVKMIIDEAGNFAPNDNDFTDQIIYHARNTLNDERIIALTYFLFDDPTHANDINSWQRANNLDDHLSRLKNLPDVEIESPTEPEPPTPDPPTPEPEPEPPPAPAQNVKMTIERRGNSVPVIVGNWFEPGVEVRLELPWGITNKTTTGNKAEFGPGGFEAGYAHMPGDYKLLIGEYEFKIAQPETPTFIKLSFEQTGPPVELQARLVSVAMPAGEAEELLAQIEIGYPGVFGVEAV